MTLQDPPGYFDKCVWPAYELAHRGLFVGNDVEHGAVRSDAQTAATEPAVAAAGQDAEGGAVPDLVLIEDRSTSTDDTREIERQVELACRAVERGLRQVLQVD